MQHLQQSHSVPALTDITSVQILKTQSCKIHFNIIQRLQFFHWNFPDRIFRAFDFYLAPPTHKHDHFNNVWRRKHHRMDSETLQFLGSCLVSLTFNPWHVYRYHHAGVKCSPMMMMMMMMMMMISATCREQVAADRHRTDGHTRSASLMSYLDAGCIKTQNKQLCRL